MKKFGMLAMAMLLSAGMAMAYSGSSGGGGGSPTGSAGGDLGGTYPNPTVTGNHFTGTSGQIPVENAGGTAAPMTNVSGDASLASTGALSVTGSSNLQQPVMFVGASEADVNPGTTFNPTTPVGTANGNLEIAHLYFNSATPGTITPPAGWSAISSCSSSGNGVQYNAYSHTAASEGGNTGAWSWTNSVKTMIIVETFANAAVDVCAATNAAAGTTVSAPAITAAATTDRIIVTATQPGASASIPSLPSITGLEFDGTVTNTESGIVASYPITSTTVDAKTVTFSGSNAMVAAQIALSFSPSSTATAPGAVTYNQSEPYVQGLNLGSVTIPGFMNSNAATTVGLTLPANAWIVSRQSATDHRILPMMRTRGVSNDIYIGGSGSGTRIALFDSAYIGSDSAISTWPRMPMVFSIAQTSISTGVNLACTKTVKAITIENDEGVWSIGASCSAPVIRVYDCGTSAPANAACSGGTQLTTNTLSGTAGTVTDGTISSANVAAGHYMCAQIQAAGSCTTLYGQETLMARPQ